MYKKKSISKYGSISQLGRDKIRFGASNFRTQSVRVKSKQVYWQG